MADPSTLTIAIEGYPGYGLALLLTGHDDPDRLLSVSGYREPAMQPRIQYAPDGDTHGSVPLGWSYQETIIAFTVFAEGATSEQDARDRIAPLVIALGRLSYTVTVTVNGATPEVWTCRPGTITPSDDRSTVDLISHTPVWAVTIPAYPIRSV